MKAKVSLRLLACAALLSGCAQYASAQFINLGFEDGPVSAYPYTPAGWTNAFNGVKYQLRTGLTPVPTGATAGAPWVYEGDYAALITLYSGGAATGTSNFLTSVTYNVADIAGMVPGNSQIEFSAAVRPWQYTEAPGHWEAYAAITFVDAAGGIISTDRTNAVIAQSTAAWHLVTATVSVPTDAVTFYITGSADFDRSLVGNAFVAYDAFTLTVQPVPEPATVGLLLGLAAVGGVFLRRRSLRGQRV